MRIHYLLLILVIIANTAKSQMPANTLSPEDAAFNTTYANRAIPKVTGKLLNLAPGEYKTLPVTFSLVTPFSTMQVKKTATVKPDGSFDLNLDYPFPYQQIWLSVGEKFFTSLLVNADVFLQLDMKKIRDAKEVEFNGDGVKFLGTDGPLNLYLNNFILYKRPEQQKRSASIFGMSAPSTANPGKIVASFDSLYDSLKAIQESYITENPSPYSWILVNECLSDYYSHLCTIYWGSVMEDALWKKISAHKSFCISNNSNEFYGYITNYIEQLPGKDISPGWKDVSLLPDLEVAEKFAIDSLKESEKMLSGYPYTKENIRKWNKVLQPRIDRLGILRYTGRYIRRLDSLFPPAKADFLKLRFNISKDLNEQKLGMDLILSTIHTSWCTTIFENEDRIAAQKIDEINKTLARSTGGKVDNTLGNPLFETGFGASLYKAPAIKGIDFLAMLKKAFPGKAIIIDRWATWCGPCLEEMPHSNALQQDSKDLPVVFVYLCTLSGSSENKWKLKVMEIKQSGIHILIDEKLDADLSNYFSFSGYPGHALIDRNGVYHPGAIGWMSEIKDKDALAGLIGK